MMTPKDGNLPAFPLVYDDPAKNSREVHPGISIRDYFASHALVGIIGSDLFLAGEAIAWADVAYEVADAMLAARLKEESKEG